MCTLLSKKGKKYSVLPVIGVAGIELDQRIAGVLHVVDEVGHVEPAVRVGGRGVFKVFKRGDPVVFGEVNHPAGGLLPDDAPGAFLEVEPVGEHEVRAANHFGIGWPHPIAMAGRHLRSAPWSSAQDGCLRSQPRPRAFALAELATTRRE